MYTEYAAPEVDVAGNRAIILDNLFLIVVSVITRPYRFVVP